MESIQWGGKNNLYNRNFNNDNKTYFPARTTTLGYEKTEYTFIIKIPQALKPEANKEYWTVLEIAKQNIHNCYKLSRRPLWQNKIKLKGHNSIFMNFFIRVNIHLYGVYILIKDSL